MYLTQKITKKIQEFTKDEDISLDLILMFNEKYDKLLDEYANCPSIQLENNILNELHMFCIEQQYCF